MSVRRSTIAAAMFILIPGCDVAPSELEGLSSANAASYIILLDQLDQIPAQITQSSEFIAICVTVRTPDDPRGRQIDPTLVARLQSHAPVGMNAIIVPGTECVETGNGLALQSGERALGLFAFFGMPGFEQWMAGYGCGGHCGQGDVYRIYHLFGYPIAVRTGAFIS